MRAHTGNENIKWRRKKKLVCIERSNAYPSRRLCATTKVRNVNIHNDRLHLNYKHIIWIHFDLFACNSLKCNEGCIALVHRVRVVSFYFTRLLSFKIISKTVYNLLFEANERLCRFATGSYYIWCCATTHNIRTFKAIPISICSITIFVIRSSLTI